MPCVLHISGEKFQPELALKIVTFKPYRVYYAGEKKKNKPNAVYSDSGFSVDVGEKENWDLSKQIQWAKTFIEKYIYELKAVSGADEMRFDFGYESRRGENGTTMFCQSDYFKPEFLMLCGELKIGIELSLYGTDSKSEQ
jgi:hypothetical protein